MNTRNNNSILDFLTFKNAFLVFCSIVFAGIFLLIPHYEAKLKTELHEKEVVEYECPIVADTVKNDFAKDSTIGWEKRLVYEQMINDIDR